MYSGYDVELPEDGDTCTMCGAPAAVRLSNVSYCGPHADNEFTGWRTFLPKNKVSTTAGQTPSPLPPGAPCMTDLPRLAGDQMPL